MATPCDHCGEPLSGEQGEYKTCLVNFVEEVCDIHPLMSEERCHHLWHIMQSLCSCDMEFLNQVSALAREHVWLLVAQENYFKAQKELEDLLLTMTQEEWLALQERLPHARR